MNLDTLQSTAQAMVAPGRGLLAMDESHPTCKKRFEALGIEVSERNRREYRSMLVTTPGLSDHISGAILFDETLRQEVHPGQSFPQHLESVGIIPGIKVDKGAKALAGFPKEKVTEGLDGLRERLDEYRRLGARFAKWRAVVTIAEDVPAATCIEANAHALARYAALCQEAELVPIVEPEVLMDGSHILERCYEVTERTQCAVFDALRRHRVALDAIVLKPNMVVAGKECSYQPLSEAIAEATLRCLMNTVPASVPGIAFLSGGLSDEDASSHLNAINRLAQTQGGAPWRLTFSYGRALQQHAMKAWGGNPDRLKSAQAIVSKRARLNGAASEGSYLSSMERDAA